MTTELPILSCEGCGHCCWGQGAGPFMAEEMAERPPEMQAKWHAYLDGPDCGNEDAWCMWFDPATRKCTVYEMRPEICIDFEMGGEDCLRIREEAGI